MVTFFPYAVLQMMELLPALLDQKYESDSHLFKWDFLGSAGSSSWKSNPSGCDALHAPTCLSPMQARTM